MCPPEVEDTPSTTVSRSLGSGIVFRAHTCSLALVCLCSTPGPSLWILFFLSFTSVHPCSFSFLTTSSLSFPLGPRSPPSHLHDPSPQRRYVEHGSSGRDSRQKGQHDRQSTPPPQRLRGNDPYTATDLVPQRRTRDYDPEYESEIKRRRIDEDSYKRRSSVERASYSPLLDRQPLSADGK